MTELTRWTGKNKAYDEDLPRARYAVHIGVKTEHVTSVIELFETANLPYAVDGDGWEVWGEAPGTDQNDDETQHIVSLTDVAALPMTLAVLAIHFAGYLVPMKLHVEREQHIVITDKGDWSKNVSGYNLDQLTPTL